MTPFRYILFFLLILLSSCGSFKITAPEKSHQKEFFHTKWVKNIDPVYDSGNRPITTASPFIKDEFLFTGDNDGNVMAILLKDGQEIWKEKQEGSYTGQPLFVHPNIIMANEEGRIFARHYLNGELAYKVDLGGEARNQPTYHEGKLFFNLSNFKVMALDAATGKILWIYKRTISAKQTMQKIAKPFIYKNKLYIGFADGHLACLSVEEGTLLWEQRINQSSKFMDVQMQPVLWNDLIWVSTLSGPLKVINPQSGGIVYQFPLSSIVSPIIWNNQLIMALVDGDIVKISADGEILLRKSFKHNSHDSLISAMTLWKEQLVFANAHGMLFAINPGNFEIIQKLSLGTDISAVFGNFGQNESYLSLISARNRLYIFE